eukprot:TRINITY_DN1765_c0_g1_i1.p1 TRINITY_DN1765_c0_g1~~TRINITY_DN1765_c0_g1_i1.p1  ORF type:complete len:240 (+),score=36.64 TRINITY_DN1765_c0_g1_i1:76-795(+)
MTSTISLSALAIILVLYIGITSCSTVKVNLRDDPPSQPKEWPTQWYAVVARNGSSQDGKNVSGLQALQKWYDWSIRSLRVECSQDGITSTFIANNYDAWLFNVLNKQCIYVHLPVTAVKPDWMVGGEYIGEKVIAGTPSWGWRKLDHLYYQSKFDTKPTFVYTPLDNKGFRNDEVYGLFDTSGFNQSKVFVLPSFCPVPFSTIEDAANDGGMKKKIRVKRQPPPIPNRGPYDPLGCFTL